ncbi:hypothetical protein CPB84DRAFT_1527936 [Gymnopilus junonius]|uniref:Uncharacterized protein n=1 Tax=Gymnopilus junonius TaxID=109634 RepID=A0A9P5NHM7_GYMJU|nr:hypothetical protein CPB84DRAFT_1527936 [Gymnopilus junonius]
MLLFIRNNSVSIKVSQKFAFDIGFTEKIHSAFVAGFLNALSSFSFVKIKDLIFAVEHGGDIVQSMDPAASRVMFSSLDALESLRTSAPILQHLLTIPRSSATGVIFPSLTRLILVQISETSGLEQSVLRAFFQNIKSKFELAPQAADFCLDLYAPANELKNCDLRFLEEYDGLKVIWGDRPFWGRRKEMKYVCGSGNPEVLNFKIQQVA